ncbi:MAG TPA: HEPN domain-containing protein [Anaerolineae bacterium]|nr:HEPN domain-containing protein [Anaerolineae bacterium]
MKSPRDHALALLKKAANDLVAAKTTITTGKALDTVCFHSQQAVEKSLKAVLAFRDVEYPWRHDLGELLELVKPLAPEITPFEDRILGMTPFAVEIRYDEEFEPSIDEAREALQTASEVHQLISAIVGRSTAEEDRP